MIHLKTKEEIDLMRLSCQCAADVLEEIGSQLKIGMSTEDIDQLSVLAYKKRGAIAATLNYHGYPKSICTSRNEVVCHGIPSEKELLKNGDIINVDVTAILNGFHGDLSKTYLIGEVSPLKQRLVANAEKCLIEAIKLVKPGARLGDLGARIQEIAEAEGFSVVRDFCGHGIGRQFHEDPQVLHYGKKGTGVELVPGMTFTIEPMVNVGTYKCKVLKDHWTAVTIDGKPSAQFEHTVVVTESGVEILTLPTSMF